MKLKLFLLLVLLTLVIALPVHAQLLDSAAAQSVAAERIGNLPLNFVPMAATGHYIAHSGGYSVMVGAREAYLAVRGSKPSELRALRMAFEGAKAPVLEAMEPLPGVTNDYRGDNPANWRLGVKSYAKLRARQVYPGVDVVYYGDQRRLEFDLVVAPRADASAIALAFSGAGTLGKDADGNLVAQLNGQPVRIARPYAYQNKDGAKVPVQAEFELAEGKVHLRLGSYDRERELIIDPVVSYVTYLGGGLGETGNAVAVDSTGAVYVTGQTCSADFPVPSPNSTSYTLEGNCNAYVSKFTVGGTSLVYTTLLGGTTPANASAAGNGIAVDASKKAYVIGTTNIQNFPGILSGVRNVYQGGDSDVFIEILNADGTILRGTYFGGSSADIGYAIALDQSANIAVAGQTCSDDFPAYNSIQTKIESCVGFAAKLDNALDIGSLPATGSPSPLSAPQPVAGKTYFFSAFYGGAPVAPPTTGVWAASTYFAPGAIVFDNTSPTPNVQVTWTGGTSGLAEPGTWSTTLLGYTTDGSITWQNYGPVAIPTAAFTEAYGVAVDPPGDVFVVGGSNSSYLANKEWPCSPPSGTGSWIIKLGGSTGDCIYTWTLGTTKTDLTATINTARAVAVDSEGRAYVTGTADSAITTTGSSYSTAIDGSTDAYLVRINIAGSAMDYGTYLGGTASEQGLGVAVDNSFGAYVVGSTQSQNFPTINPISNPNTGIDLSLGGTKNGFLAKFTSDGSGLIFSSYLGGSGSDRINGVAVDANQNVYMAGTSSSTDLETILLANTVNPVTSAVTFTSYVPPQQSYGGNSDAFIAMVAGSSLPTTAVSPGSLVYGEQAVGTQSAAKPVQYTIQGSSDVYISNISISSTDSAGATTSAFQIVAENNPGGTSNGADCKIGTIGPNVAAPLTPSTGCQVWIAFTPPSQLQQFGKLTIQDDTNSLPHTVYVQGQGSTPTDAFSPASLTFSTQAVGVPSAAKTITLSNTSASVSSTLLIDSITLSGTNASDFTESDNCQPSVDGQKSCTISILFTPQAAGARTATMTVTDNANGSPHTIALSGTGTLVSATITPASYTFPSQQTNVLSSPQVFTVTNNDTTQTLNVTGVSVTGSFVISENTCAQVAPSSTCAVSVQYSPTTAGTQTGVLSLAGNGKNGSSNWPATVSLSGTAGANASLTAVTSTLTANVGGSGTQQWTLSNSSAYPLNIYGISISGVAASLFTQGNNCGTTLLAGSVANPTSCIITVVFTPTAPGNFNATLSVSSDAAKLTVTPSAGSTASSAALLGVATAPTATLSATSLNFNNQPLNTSSGATANPVTLTNNGNGPLNLTSIVFSGAAAAEYTQNNNCGTQVAAGANCAINVVFTPTAANSQAATMVITDNATPATQSVSLVGSGYQLGAPTYAPLPTSGLSWSNEPINTAVNDALTIAVTNNDTSFPLSLGTPAVTGDFKVAAVGTTCGTSLATNGSCVIAVTFLPTASGTRTGTLSLLTSAATSASVWSLSGTGGGNATQTVTAINLGSQNVGTTGPSQNVVLTNTSTFPVNISAVTLTGSSAAQFVATNNCGTTVPGSSSCSIAVQFKPTATGVQTATLTIASDAATAFSSVALSGNGTTPVITLSPTSVTFTTAQGLNTSSAAQAVTMTNSGTGALNISSLAFSGTAAGDFSETNNCGSALAVNASCTINIVFTPMAAGSRTATLTLTDDATNSPQTIQLSGTGLGSGTISLSSTALAFTPTTLTQSLTVTNSASSSSLTLTGISISGTNSSQFSIGSSSSCAVGTALSSASACTIIVKYAVGTSTANAVLTITGSATNSPQTVALSGTVTASGGTTPDFTLSPNFSSVSVVYGNTATFSVSVAPENGFDQSVAFTCTANNGASCAVSPTTVTMDGTTTKSVQVSVGTSSLTLASARRLQPVFFALLPFTLFGVVLTRRRGGVKLALLLVAICLVMGMASCGSGGSTATSSQFPMTVGVTLTATSSGTTPVTHTQALSVVVTAK